MIDSKFDFSLFDHVWQHSVLPQYSREERLHRGMRYALEGEGKRVRARLAMMAASHYTKNPRAALSAACAVEMIHAYSLIHDDLPCMDDDDWRRGRPSTHKAFDEATALLAGDGLLTDAFRVLTDEIFFPENSFVAANDQARQVAILAKAAGGHGMVLGQSRDLWWTGRGDAEEEHLNSIHIEKTGALIGASCAMGAAAGGASAAEVAAFERFGRLVGIAFQAIDDTLDLAKGTGKSVGKDAAQGKLTYLKFHSPQEVLAKAEALTKEAITCLPPSLDGKLASFAETLVFRSR